MSRFKPSFIRFVEDAVVKNQFVGTGNPNASILIVGKESSRDNDDYHLNNHHSWNDHIQNNTTEICSYDKKKGDFAGGSTWNKYQKLIEYYREEPHNQTRINFLEDVFTTELNNDVNLRTADADKSTISLRKELFSKHNFFREFPVVILACSDYIVNVSDIKEEREIDTIFDVTFDQEDGVHVNSDSKVDYTFYTHYSKDRRRLVIHTRQLSTSVSDEFLRDIAVVVREHFESLDEHKEVHL